MANREYILGYKAHHQTYYIVKGVVISGGVLLCDDKVKIYSSFDTNILQLQGSNIPVLIS